MRKSEESNNLVIRFTTEEIAQHDKAVVQGHCKTRVLQMVLLFVPLDLNT